MSKWALLSYFFGNNLFHISPSIYIENYSFLFYSYQLFFILKNILKIIPMFFNIKYWIFLLFTERECVMYYKMWLKIRRSRIVSVNSIFHWMTGKSDLLKLQNIKVKENVILNNSFNQSVGSLWGYYFKDDFDQKQDNFWRASFNFKCN